MEKFPHSHRRNNPSFSSSLLDSIYRSIDQSDRLSPGSPLSSTSKKQTTSIEKWIPKPPPPTNHTRDFFTSSSSDRSSFGGFSSSDADFTARPRHVPARCDRYCSDLPKERKGSGSIRSRIRNLRNLRTPTSPGARLAAFLNSIFVGGSGKPKKPKFAGGQQESARSCVNRMLPSSRDGRQRSVRFSSESIAAHGGSREKRHFGEVPMLLGDRQLVLGEFLRGFEIEEEETDCESVSSSELFELESFTTMGQFRDELPVYGTTNFTTNRSIAHGYMAQN